MTISKTVSNIVICIPPQLKFCECVWGGRETERLIRVFQTLCLKWLWRKEKLSNSELYILALKTWPMLIPGSPKLEYLGTLERSLAQAKWTLSSLMAQNYLIPELTECLPQSGLLVHRSLSQNHTHTWERPAPPSLPSQQQTSIRDSLVNQKERWFPGVFPTTPT